MIMDKRKALGALFPYVVRLEQGGHQEMVETFTCIAAAINSKRFVWDHIKLDQVLTLTSPHIPWSDGPYDRTVVAKWALAALVIPPTEDLSQSVIDVLLHTASVNSLRPHIPTGVWTWLKKQPSLPSQFLGWPEATNKAIVCQVRELGDIEVIEGYLLLVWSEWRCVENLEQDSIGVSKQDTTGSSEQDSAGSSEQGFIGSQSGLVEMHISILEDFSGVGIGHHRENLINRLDYVLGELDQGLEYLEQHKQNVNEDYIQTAKEQYGGLRRLLLEVDREAMKTLTRMSPGLFFLAY